MFANFNFAWPVSLKGLLNPVSASNMNLQLLAPECSLKLGFKQQWFGVAMLPLVILSSLGVIIVLLKLAHRAKVYLAARQARRPPPPPELAAIEGLAFTALYCLYIQVPRLPPLQCFLCRRQGG